MRRRNRRAGCGVVLAAVLGGAFLIGLVSQCGGGGSDTGSPSPTPTTTPPTRHAKPTHRATRKIPADAHGPYRVIRVVDGDTVHVAVGSRDIDVRLIGVDAPETVKPNTPVQCWGPQASARIRALLDGRSLYLEYDPAQPRRDRYGRTLAYVWLGDGRMLNRNLILQGYGRAETQYGAYRYESSFLTAEHTAQTHHRGLWSHCH